MKLLRQYIRQLIAEVDKDREKPDNLLIEPDDASDDEDEEQEEQSVAADVAGVTTPLGTGPTYPADKGKRRKAPWLSLARVFGNAKPANKK